MSYNDEMQSLVNMNMDNDMENHKNKMKLVFDDIKNPIYCDNCNKFIFMKIYSTRGGDENCCSFECIDELCG